MLKRIRLTWEDGVLAAVLLAILVVGIRFISTCPAGRVIVHVLLAAVFAIAVWALVRFRKPDDPFFFAHVVFPVALAFLAVLYTVFFTPCGVPDENFHYAKSYEVANVLTPGMDVHDVRTEDANFYEDGEVYSTVLVPKYWERMRDYPIFATATGVERDYEPLKKYTLDLSVDLPHLKLPSALGIIVGRTVGLSGVYTYLLGRLFNALCAVVIIAIAVRMTPVGKNAIMVVSMLPMTLHLLASYSYDAGYISLGILVTALLMRLYFAEQQVSSKLMVGYVISSTLLATGKLIYVLIAFLALLVPNRRFSSRRAAWGFRAAVLLVPAAFMVLLSTSRVLTMTSGAPKTAKSLNERGNEYGYYYTLGDIFGHPLRSMRFLWQTLVTMGHSYLTTLVGGSLGWLQVEIKAPFWEVILLVVMLVLGVVQSKDDGGALSRSLRIGFAVVALMGAAAVTLSMWIGWTFTYDEWINGIQGRYMLPYLPGVLLAIRPRRLSVPVALAPTIITVFSVFSCMYLAQICRMLLLA